MTKENKVEKSAEDSTEQKSAVVQTEELKIQKTDRPVGYGFAYFLILVIASGLIAVSYYFLEEQKNLNALIKQDAGKLLILDKQISDYDTENNKRDEAISQNSQQVQIVL